MSKTKNKSIIDISNLVPPFSSNDPWYYTLSLPKLRASYPKMIAKEFASVQPIGALLKRRRHCCSNPKIRISKKINQVKYRFYCDNCGKHFEKSIHPGFYPCMYCFTTGVRIVSTNYEYTLRCEDCKGTGIISWTDNVRMAYEKKGKDPFVILGVKYKFFILEERTKNRPYIILTGILD